MQRPGPKPARMQFQEQVAEQKKNFGSGPSTKASSSTGEASAVVAINAVMKRNAKIFFILFFLNVFCLKWF